MYLIFFVLDMNLDSEVSQRTLESLLVKTLLGIHTQTVMLMESLASLSSWRVPLPPTRVSQGSLCLLCSGIFKAGCYTSLLSGIEGLCYIPCRQIFVNTSASTVFACWHGNVLSFWLMPRAIFALSHLFSLLGIYRVSPVQERWSSELILIPKSFLVHRPFSNLLVSHSFRVNSDKYQEHRTLHQLLIVFWSALGWGSLDPAHCSFPFLLCLD